MRALTVALVLLLVVLTIGDWGRTLTGDDHHADLVHQLMTERSL